MFFFAFDYLNTVLIKLLSLAFNRVSGLGIASKINDARILIMSFYCEHTDEWSDDSLLLDDDNTSTKNCRRCKKKLRNPSNDILTPNNWAINGAGSNSNMFIENEKVHDEDQLDSPDDSPLLRSFMKC